MDSFVKIAKGQTNPDNFLERILYYERARDAFGDLLLTLRSPDFCLFLPAYIGISPKEGSGLYDPVRENGINHSFYKMDRYLHVNLNDLRDKLSSYTGKKAMLLVHYWGYVDPRYQEIVACARESDCFVIEDMAHAFYSEYVDYSCGYMGEASFYSLHKMFPRNTGGMLKVRNSVLGENISQKDCNISFPADYNYHAIAARRKENAALWESLLRGHQDKFEILRPCAEYANNTPQTYPVRVIQKDRFEIYKVLNEKGYGAVSLYHTMIDPIREQGFVESLELARTILNLPVHQDVTGSQIKEMFEMLLETYCSI